MKQSFRQLEKNAPKFWKSEKKEQKYFPRFSNLRKKTKRKSGHDSGKTGTKSMLNPYVLYV
jgi:hypothetical protein